MSNSFDINKLLTTILYRKLHPIPFVKLRTTLEIFFHPSREHAPMMGKELLKLGLQEEAKDQLFELWKELEKSLKADEEIKIEMDFVKDGYDSEVDKLRKIAYHSDELLMEYQQFLVKATGVQNVKLKYVMNQGYFIEITNKDIEAFEEKIRHCEQREAIQEQPLDCHDSVPSSRNDNTGKFNLQRRQTLKGNQRYSSPYLEHVQEAVLSSKDQLGKLEYQILGALAQKIGNLANTLSSFAQKIAELDVYCSHAIFATEHKYIQPELNATDVISIE